jgi:hypothetical protein
LVLPDAKGLCPACRNYDFTSGTALVVAAPTRFRQNIDFECLPAIAALLAIIALLAGQPLAGPLLSAALAVGIVAAQERWPSREHALTVIRIVGISGIAALALYGVWSRLGTTASHFSSRIGSAAPAALGLALAVTNAVDFVLDRRAKDRLADVFLRLWYRLDDLARKPYPTLLWQPRTQRILSIVAVFVWIALQFILASLREFVSFGRDAWKIDWPLFVILGVLIAAVSWIVARKVLRREHQAVYAEVVSAQSVRQYFNILGHATVAYALFPVLTAALSFFRPIPIVRTFAWLVQFTISIIFIRAFTEFWLLLILLVLSLIFVSVLTVAAEFVRATAFVLRRVLEVNRNVLAGISAALLLASALIKAL